MRATRAGRAARGVVMLIVVILVALLIIIALLLASGAFNAETSVEAVAAKYRILNSAEGGVNAALNELAENPNAGPTCYPGNLNGMVNSGCIVDNNLQNGSPAQNIPDPATGGTINVPGNAAYLYGESSTGGGRKVYIEAIADLAPPLTLPNGAINAVGSVNDLAPETIDADPSAMSPDANVNANSNINVTGGQPSTVNGVTAAVGTDSLPGLGGKMNSNSSPVAFPNAVQVQQAAQNAQSLARAGAHYTGASLSSGSGGTVSGNAFIDGDVMLNAGTITLTGGSYVYINGNLCVSGTGTLANLNTGQNIVVVSGDVGVQSTGTFKITPLQNSLLLVMGADPTQNGPCGSNYAADFEQTSAAAPIGTIFAANGSLYLGGAAALTGALDATRDIYIGGGPTSSFTYDAAQAQTTMTTGTLTYTAYNEY
jgi:formylmethanofuran dehydrogenase subunit C